MINVAELAELAKEVGESDPIEWGHFNVTKDQAYHLMASGILEHYNNCEPDEQHLMILAVATHLSVENFLLNAQNLELKEAAMRM